MECFLPIKQNYAHNSGFHLMFTMNFIREPLILMAAVKSLMKGLNNNEGCLYASLLFFRLYLCVTYVGVEVCGKRLITISIFMAFVMYLTIAIVWIVAFVPYTQGKLLSTIV